MKHLQSVLFVDAITGIPTHPLSVPISGKEIMASWIFIENGLRDHCSVHTHTDGRRAVATIVYEEFKGPWYIWDPFA